MATFIEGVKGASGVPMALLMGFFAGISSPILLDTGKTIPVFKGKTDDGKLRFRANDGEKAKAKAYFEKLTKPEQQEVIDLLTPMVKKSQAQHQDFRNYTKMVALRGAPRW